MKKMSIILAGAAMFDLGTFVVASQAAETVHLYLKADKAAPTRNIGGTDIKSGKASAYFKFWKIDSVNTRQACIAKGGTVEKQDQQPVCKMAGEGKTNVQNIPTTR